MSQNVVFAQREQWQDHEEMVHRLEVELDEHHKHVPERGSKALALQNYREKEAFLQHEVTLKLTFTSSYSNLVQYLNNLPVVTDF